MLQSKGLHFYLSAELQQVATVGPPDLMRSCPPPALRGMRGGSYVPVTVGSESKRLLFRQLHDSLYCSNPPLYRL